ncbi:MAG: hypothetical protein LBI85_00035 [Spirochaetaceae bacterium]|jgi:hypothetical protein|nr:hypothetical protein [Spirochaetaceae bacterium]
MKIQRRVLFMVSAMVLFAAAAYGQTAAETESLLDAGEISFSQAAYFTLASVVETPPDDPEAAFAEAGKRGWLPAGADGGGSVTLGDLSLLLVKAFNLKGGLMYRFFPSSRYAYREMTSRGFIEGRAYPDLKVSGELFLRILGNILAGGTE